MFVSARWAVAEKETHEARRHLELTTRRYAGFDAILGDLRARRRDGRLSAAEAELEEARLQGMIRGELRRLQELPAPAAAVPGEASAFVSENYPDGTIVRPGERFTKQWVLRNVGGEPCRGRRLRRQDAGDDPQALRSATHSAIPDTPPGAECRATVELTAPLCPGAYYAEWKMVDAAERPSLAGQTPLYVLIRVVVEP